MEQVFDFREFMLMLLRKWKLPIILLVILGILGAGFGFWRGSREAFLSTSSAAVTLSRTSLDPSALTNSMSEINALSSSDYFYNGLRPDLRDKLGEQVYLSLFPKGKEPTLAKFKEIVKFYTKGNLFLVDVTSSDEAVANLASGIAMTYAREEIDNANPNISLADHGQLSVSLNEQNGTSSGSEALKFGLLGMAGGFALGILWVFLADVFSVKVSGPEDLKKYRLPLLGELPKKA